MCKIYIKRLQVLCQYNLQANELTFLATVFMSLGRIQVLHKGGSVSNRRRLELLEGSGGMLPREILKFISSEMPFPAFWGLI